MPKSAMIHITVFSVLSLYLTGAAAFADPACEPTSNPPRIHADMPAALQKQIRDWIVKTDRQIPIDNENLIRGLEENAGIRNAFAVDSALREKYLNDPRLKALFEQDAELRKVFLRGPDLKYLYASDSGVREGYTIREHTLRVLREFENQRGHYELEKIKLPSGTDPKVLLKYTLALHDIGKSIMDKAVRKTGQAKNKSFEQDCIVPIAKKVLVSLKKFTASDIRLATALIDNDSIGNYLKGNLPMAQAKAEIQAQAKKAGLSPKDFVHLQRLYFMSDAGSYPFLQEKVFRLDANGKRVPQNEQLDQLENSF